MEAKNLFSQASWKSVHSSGGLRKAIIAAMRLQKTVCSSHSALETLLTQLQDGLRKFENSNVC
jgi:hypothetical protein